MLLLNALQNTRIGGFVEILTCLCLALAVVGPPGVVAAVRHSPVLAGVHQAIGTVVQLRLPVLALPVAIAVSCIRHNSELGLAGILLHLLLAPTYNIKEIVNTRITKISLLGEINGLT